MMVRNTGPPEKTTSEMYHGIGRLGIGTHDPTDV